MHSHFYRFVKLVSDLIHYNIYLIYISMSSQYQFLNHGAQDQTLCSSAQVFLLGCFMIGLMSKSFICHISSLKI